MAQITSGIRTILSHPLVYDFFQKLMGASKVRKLFVDKYIRPSEKCQILDIGCGTAEILNYIPDGVSYWGVDISPVYIRAAKKKFGDRGCFYCGILSDDIAKKFPKFDRIISIGVLHHLDDVECSHFFKLASGLLNDGGLMVTIDPVYSEGQSIFAKFLISRDRGQNVRDQASYVSLAQKDFSIVESAIRHQKWIPYTHAILTCKK